MGGWKTEGDVRDFRNQNGRSLVLVGPVYLLGSLRENGNNSNTNRLSQLIAVALSANCNVTIVVVVGF